MLWSSNSAACYFCLVSFMVACLFMCFLVLVSELMFKGAFSVDSGRFGLRTGNSRENNTFSSSGYSEETNLESLY